MKKIRVQFINRHSTAKYFGYIKDIRYTANGMFHTATGTLKDALIAMLANHDTTHEMYNNVNYRIKWDNNIGIVSYDARDIEITDDNQTKCNNIW